MTGITKKFENSNLIQSNSRQTNIEHHFFTYTIACLDGVSIMSPRSQVLRAEYN